MEGCTSPSMSMDLNDVQLGWERLFAANAFLDESYLCADTDASFEKQHHNGQVPNEVINSQGCDRRSLTDMDDNTYAGLSMDGLHSWIGSIEAPLEPCQEVDVNMSSLDQETLENILSGYERNYKNRILQPHAGDLQLQQWQLKSPCYEQVAMTNPSTNCKSLPSIRSSSLSGSGANDFCQEQTASSASGQQCAVEYESQSQQPHVLFFSNNSMQTALANMADAALTHKGGPYSETFRGFSNGVDVDHCLIPLSLRKDSTENLVALVSLARRRGLPTKRRRIERLPEYKKTQPSCQLLSVALVSSYSDENVTGPQRDLSYGQIEANMNVRKTRMSLLHRRSITSNVVQQTEVRLVTCDRKTGVTMNAALVYKDDQYCGLADAIPHCLTFTIANMHVADLFTKQLYALLEKEGFELIDDKFQPVTPRDNSFLCSTSTSSSAICNGIQQLDFLTANEIGKCEGAICDYTTEITGSRVGSFPRISQTDFSPGVPANFGSQLQLSQTQQVQAHLSQFNRTSVHVEAQNQVHERREQMVWPRRKFILPPAAWGA